MTFGSLFAWIGGFDLGFERAGLTCKWQVEIDPFCRRVLAKHWPHVERFEDVRTVGAHNLPAVDVLCGGFPCQDISLAGKGEGIDGARSGLWAEFDRLIGELRPDCVVVENVSALLARGFGRVLGDLAARGYDAEWDCLSASAFGAPHQRDRVWIVAYTNSGRQQERAQFNGSQIPHSSDRDSRRQHTDGLRHLMADANRQRFQEPARAWSSVFYDQAGAPARRELSRGIATTRDSWAIEPNVGRVAHGIPARVDRLRGLGNAVVPQIPEWIGRRLMERVA
jgi:DNA (cytosine-5)-methyltransferase 1